jgi:hypothetical protein
MAIRCIREMAQNSDRISIHDVAVSNGQTAVEFYQKLKKADMGEIFYLASDASTSFNLITKNGRQLSVITDTHGNLIQVIFPPFVFNTNERESLLYYPLNRLILFGLLQTRVKAILRERNSGSSSFRVEKIDLMDPHCLSLAREAKDFEVKHYDILEPMDRPFDVVRAMNVLNPDHLSPNQIFCSVMNFLKGLTQGGLLISGSNQGSGTTVDGSIFRREDRRFAEIARSGLGSPVCASILKAEIPPL